MKLPRIKRDWPTTLMALCGVADLGLVVTAAYVGLGL